MRTDGGLQTELELESFTVDIAEHRTPRGMFL